MTMNDGNVTGGSSGSAGGPPPTVPEAIVHKGRGINLEPAACSPGDVGQLVVKLSSAADLMGIHVEAPGKVVRVIAGPFNSPTKEVEAEGGTWESIIGKRIPGGAHVIVLVKNEGPDVTALRGAIYVENEERPPAKPAIIHGQGPGSGGRRNTHQSPHTQQSRPTGVAPNRGRGPVVPGQNEVAVLMKRGNCERVLALVKGGAPIHHSETQAIIRELENALGIGK